MMGAIVEEVMGGSWPGTLYICKGYGRVTVGRSVGHIDYLLVDLLLGELRVNGRLHVRAGAAKKSVCDRSRCTVVGGNSRTTVTVEYCRKEHGTRRSCRSGRSWAWTGPGRTGCTASCTAAAAAEGRMRPGSWTSTPEDGRFGIR